VNDNLVLVTNLLVHKELSDVGTLISGKLKNFTEFGVHKNTTVAFKSLLQSLRDLSNVQIVSEALNCGDAFTSVSLLNADMNFGVVLSSVAGEGV